MGKLTDIGENQGLLLGIWIRLNYPDFLNGIPIDQIAMEARYIQRTKETVSKFIDGITYNISNIKLKKTENNNSFPPLF